MHVQVVEKEALALKKEYGTPRLTALEAGGDGEINDADVIANIETLVVSSPAFPIMSGNCRRLGSGVYGVRTFDLNGRQQISGSGW